MKKLTKGFWQIAAILLVLSMDTIVKSAVEKLALSGIPVIRIYSGIHVLSFVFIGMVTAFLVFNGLSLRGYKRNIMLKMVIVCLLVVLMAGFRFIDNNHVLMLLGLHLYIIMSKGNVFIGMVTAFLVFNGLSLRGYKRNIMLKMVIVCLFVVLMAGFRFIDNNHVLMLLGLHLYIIMSKGNGNKL